MERPTKVAKVGSSDGSSSASSRKIDGSAAVAAGSAGAAESEPVPRLPQDITVPESVCVHTMNVLREHAEKFNRVDKGDEPPLRVLKQNLFGEAVETIPEGPGSIPKNCWIERDGLNYLGYRFDQDVCDEAVHATPALQSIFGVGDKDGDAIFRNVLGYAKGSEAFGSIDGNVLAEEMRKALLPAALKVFGEENNPEAYKLSRIYSIYSNCALPGQIINLHLDVPEFVGVDRSTCPNWLLVCAHCSGLPIFDQARVRNITTVFYPKSSPGGDLAVYPPIQHPAGANAPGAKVYGSERGAAVVMDADSCFHHSEQARQPGAPATSSGGGSGEMPGETEVPKYPSRSGLRLVKSEDSDVGKEAVWGVVNLENGEELALFPESAMRFSISCKIHVFGSQEEVDRYEGRTNTGASLSGADIVEALTEDLKGKGKIPEELLAAHGDKIPLALLGPIFVREYVGPTAPTTATVEDLWCRYHNVSPTDEPAEKEDGEEH